MIDAKIGKCPVHNKCILIWIGDCEFHTRTDIKGIREEIESMED